MRRKSPGSIRLTVGIPLAAMAVGAAACSGGTPSANPTTSSTPSSSTSTTSTQPATPKCTTAGLQVTAGMGSGAAGTIGQVILFENSGTGTCLLHGFPGVAGLDSAGNQIAQASREVNNAPFTGSAASLPTVQLAPGNTASALVLSSDVPTGSATACVTYAALLVTPPNATQSVRVSVQMPGCAGLRVGPVFSGTTGGTQ
ncbi:MAG: DUF4232 domain-containing protein [Acidimicrobiales bacterium]